MNPTAAPRIAAGIEEIIRRDRIAPGERLPTEHALARRFRASRPAVREAIQALRALGVVESGPRVGLRVLPFDPGSLFGRIIPRIRTREERAELYELRCLLEPAVLRLVVRRASRTQLERLEAMLLAPQPGLARDLAFHEELWRLAGNRYVWGLRDLLLRFFADLDKRRGGRISEATLRKTNAEHLAIVRALKTGNLARAQRLLALNLGTYRP